MTRPRRLIQTQIPIHITARSLNREPFPIALDRVWEILTRYLYLAHHAFGLEIHAFVLMPNHFHLIARDTRGELSLCMAYVMRESSKEIARAAGRINRTWGTRFHTTLISDARHYLCAYKYVYRNPVAGRIVSNPLHYEFSTLPLLLGQKPCLIPIAEDVTLFSDVEGTLSWLATAFPDDEAKKIKCALRKKEFKFAADRRHGN